MIQVESLSFAYEPGASVLDNVSFEIEKGRCLVILGNNGAGKSTLLKCLGRIHRAQSGRVIADGSDLLQLSRRETARRIAYVPQHSHAADIMVFDAVLLGRRPYIRWDAAEADRHIVQDLLERLDLQTYSARSLTSLSGGELQKVVLARALAQEPQYLLLDEPTSWLDPRNQHEMLRLVREIAETQRIGVAMVLHDLNLAVRYCDRFLFLHDARVYAHGDLSIVTPEAIRQVYRMEADVIQYRGQTLIVPQ